MRKFILQSEQWCARQPRWVMWLVAALWYNLITYLSHIPTSSSASTKNLVGGDDALNAAFRFCAHLGVFGVLGALFYAALRREFTFARFPFFLALCFVCCAGILDEVHQSYVPGRFARLQDVVTDTIGGTIAIATLIWLRTRRVIA